MADSIDKNQFSDPDYRKDQGCGITSHVKDIGLLLSLDINSALDRGDLYW